MTLIYKSRDIIKEAAGRQAVFKTRCRYKDFGIYDSNSIPFYNPKAWSALPNDLRVCQECFKASIAPTPLAESFAREIISSKDPERIVECVFSRPTNEPAWRASIEQGREAPLALWLEQAAVLEANLSKCPRRPRSDSQSPASGRVGFRALRKNDSFKVCEYHFAAFVQGTWMEDEFVRLHHISSATICDFGGSEVSATLALTLTKRSFNFKIFEDWARAYQSLSTCNGIIEAGNRTYTLPAVHHTSAQRFQVCETCYRLVFVPHAIIQPRLLEITGAQIRTRGICIMGNSSSFGYIEALLKATWKHDPASFLEFARDQAPIPPCPGPGCLTRMKVWYGSNDVPGFICCESCFLAVVFPSTLCASFGHFPDADCLIEHCCGMSVPQVKALFATACDVGSITAFGTSLEQLVAQAQADSATEQRAEHDDLQPENNLSKVRGTPQQIQQVEALRDEIWKLDSERQQLLDKGVAEFADASVSMGWGHSLALVGGERTTDRVYDGHGTWFDNSTEADASAKMIEARFKMEESSKLEPLIHQRRISLRALK